jgi:large subunit ribosomal protein L9
VSARDLAEALEAAGHKVAKNQIVLDRPIKGIGVQEVKIALHPEVSVAITVNVARSPEEAELQAQGVDVMAQMFEKDVAGFTEERAEGLEPGEIAPETEAAPAAEAEAAPAAEAEAEAAPAVEAEAEVEAPAAEAEAPAADEGSEEAEQA